MDWIEISSAYQQQPSTPLLETQKLNNCERFTLYDHNFSTPKINMEEQTFQVILNSMKINRQYTSITKIKGNIKIGLISIYSSFVSQSIILNGKWNYQKMELLKFALKYNQKSLQNMIFQINPINGQISIGAHFMASPLLLRDHHYLRQIVTNYCTALGDESRKIFNTIIEIVFGNGGDQPYLKSLRVSSSAFPPHIKMEKLLDKIKQLIATSSYYQIRSDIVNSHSNRSWFKKKFKPAQLQKYLIKDQYIPLIMAYQHHFHRKHLENLPNYNKKDKNQRFIKKYEDIEQKYEIDFAKHLKLEELLQDEPVIELPYIDHQQFIGEDIGQSNLQQQKIIVWQKISDKNSAKRHPNIAKIYYSSSKKNIRYTKTDLVPLSTYLETNKRVIGLSTRLEIMCQICQAMMYLHLRQIGFPIRLEDILIGFDRVIQIKNLYRCKFINKPDKGEAELDPVKDKQFPYAGVWKPKTMENNNEVQLKSQLQKCDVYNLGIVLYQILFEKLPFYRDNPSMNEEYFEQWENSWVLDTQYYSMEGGKIAKLLGWLLLKSMSLLDYECRPYIQWITIIMFETKNSIQGLF